jgi:hypothetical protein
MTQNEKAERYEDLVRKGDIIQRDMSRLKSEQIGNKGNEAEYDRKLIGFERQMEGLKFEMDKLFQD